MNSLSLSGALVCVAAMALVILLCRAFPFLFFSGSPRKEKGGLPDGALKGAGASPGARKTRTTRKAALLGFVEKTVPPVAMTVLAFNALGAAFLGGPGDGLLSSAAAVFTALVHIWKRNSLLSIFGGTALYMVLIRVAG